MRRCVSCAIPGRDVNLRGYGVQVVCIYGFGYRRRRHGDIQSWHAETVACRLRANETSQCPNPSHFHLSKSIDAVLIPLGIWPIQSTREFSIAMFVFTYLSRATTVAVTPMSAKILRECILHDMLC